METTPHCLHCRRLVEHTCGDAHRVDHCPSFVPRTEADLATPRLHRRDLLPLAMHFGFLALLFAGILLLSANLNWFAVPLSR
jgi:hypothetical protein